MHKLATSADLDPLLQKMKGRRIVMLGEASHGTHEYYTWRTAITKRLIEEQRFNFIAVEGDWPDCFRINRYVKGYKDAGDNIRDVLNQFDRWPTWMWANWEIAALAEWLRQYNATLPEKKKVGFYGLDVYSLWDSMRSMINYLETEDPQAALYVKQAIACFEPYGEDEYRYANNSLSKSCREQVTTLLREIRSKSMFYNGDREAGFNAEQNALIAVNAERYYSSMIGFNEQSWNIRDQHMMETLENLLEFYSPDAKAVVWEHNTHIGDARATGMADAGMVNTGQLAREEYGSHNVFLAGFASYEGKVIAGEQWGAPMEEMEMPAARKNSIEAWIHERYGSDGYILFNEENDTRYSKPIAHRAIGVVYDPDRDRISNYVPSILSKRYDALIYIDQTSALHPLHLAAYKEKIPETYPFGV